MSLKALKLEIIEMALSTNDLNLLEQARRLLKKANIKKQKPPKKRVYIEPKGVSFEEWNAQFNDKEKLEEFLPEYGMTLKSFRYSIWTTEQAEEIPYKQFKAEVNNMVNELKAKHTY